MEMVIVKPVYVNAYPIMSMHQIVHTMDVSILMNFNWYLRVANKRSFFFLSKLQFPRFLSQLEIIKKVNKVLQIQQI